MKVLNGELFIFVVGREVNILQILENQNIFIFYD
jgi:hypothetical protein